MSTLKGDKAVLTPRIVDTSRYRHEEACCASEPCVIYETARHEDSDEEEGMPRLTGSTVRARNVYRNTSKKSSKVAMMRGMSARRPSAPQPTSRAPASFTLLGLVV